MSPEDRPCGEVENPVTSLSTIENIKLLTMVFVMKLNIHIQQLKVHIMNVVQL